MLRTESKMILKDLLKTNPYNYTYYILKNVELYNMIQQSIPDYIQTEPMRIQVYWFLNDLEEYPRCLTCDKPLDTSKFLSVIHGYRKFCCVKCMRNSNEYLNSYSKTCFTKYGCASSNQSADVKLRKKQSCQLKYGVDNVSQLSEHKKKVHMKWLEKTKSELEKIKEKKKKTLTNHYSKEELSNIFKEANKKVDKSHKSYALKLAYVNRDPMVEQQRVHKMLATKAAWPKDKLKEIKIKMQQTCLKKYGALNISQSEYFRKLKKSRICEYDGFKFDSTWELKVYQYCKSKGFTVVYEPCKLRYEFNNKIHYYFPDFRINGKLYEVKGDHFFNNIGELIWPYKNKNWTEDKYNYMNNLAKAKHQCMIANNVYILKYSEIQHLEDVLW